MESSRWKVRFYTIWAGQALSLVGSALVQFALIWWLTETTGSAATLATASAVGFLPVIFLGPFAGTLVDRWPRKWVLILSDGLIALATAALALLFWLGIAQPWHVFVILFVRSLGDCFQNPAMMSTTPLMVPRDQLARIAGMNATLQGTISFAAPPLGALLLGLVDVQGILPLDVVTAIVAIVPLLLVPVPQPAEKGLTGAGLGSVIKGLGDGLRYVWDRPGLRGLVATSALLPISSRPIVAFLPLLVRDHFGGGALELGWLSSAAGIGQIAGGLLMGIWGGYERKMATHVMGGIGIALCAVLMAVTPTSAFGLALVAWAGVGMSGAVRRSSLRAAEQAVVRPEMQGRYFAVLQSVNRSMAPVALALTSPLVDQWGVSPFFFFAAGIFLAVALVRRFVPAIYYIEDQPDVEGAPEE